MRGLLLLVIVLAILIGGGLLTAGLSQQGGVTVPGVRVQTTDPRASTLYMTPEKGIWALVWAVFITLGPLVTLAAIITGFFWFTSRQVEKAKRAPRQAIKIFSLDASDPRTLVGVLARSPVLSISLLLIVIVGTAIFLAAVGVFTPR